ncbi:hypothetical protein MMPV_002178 [Pyropia vietnamensis]
MDGAAPDAADAAPPGSIGVAADAPPPTGQRTPPQGTANPPAQAAPREDDCPSRGSGGSDGYGSPAAAASTTPASAPTLTTDAGAVEGASAGAGSSIAAVTPSAATSSPPLVVTLIVKNPGARGARPPLRLEVPLDGTTIAGVKHALTGLVPGAPPVSAQRLIFAGHLLKNGQTFLPGMPGVHGVNPFLTTPVVPPPALGGAFAPPLLPPLLPPLPLYPTDGDGAAMDAAVTAAVAAAVAAAADAEAAAAAMYAPYTGGGASAYTPAYGIPANVVGYVPSVSGGTSGAATYPPSAGAYPPAGTGGYPPAAAGAYLPAVAGAYVPAGAPGAGLPHQAATWWADHLNAQRLAFRSAFDRAREATGRAPGGAPEEGARLDGWGGAPDVAADVAGRGGLAGGVPAPAVGVVADGGGGGGGAVDGRAAPPPMGGHAGGGGGGAAAAVAGGGPQPRARRVFALRLQVDWALMLKLAFVIVLLGQDASHRRLYGLVAGGLALYMALSGRLTGVLAWAARAAPSPGRMAAALAPGGWMPNAGATDGGGGGIGGAAAGGGQAAGPPTARMLGVCVYAFVYGLVCSLVPAWRAEEIRGVADWWRTMAEQRAEGGDADGEGAPAVDGEREGAAAQVGHAHED